MAVKIEFVDTTNSVPEEYWPKPAKFVLPDWYKFTPSYTEAEKDVSRGGGRGTNATIKRCVPVFDALTSGYIIFSSADVDVAIIDGEVTYTWPSDEPMISSHPAEQFKRHPTIGGDSAVSTPKWYNPWSIRTPKGYSALFVTPFHRESLFYSLEGVVDTDMYTNPVQFPFQMKDPNWTGIIPAGTPIVQVIPFKRESYEHTVKRSSELKENYPQIARNKLMAKFFNSYRDGFWSKKEYN
jgi:hypothetical protein